MTSEGIDGYLSDLADGVAVFCRVVICDDDEGSVKAFDKRGEFVAGNSIKSVASYGVMKDTMGIARYHVTIYVRRACLQRLGKLPATQVPF